MGRHISNTSRIVSVSSSPSSSTDLDLETSIWNKTSSGFETSLGGGGGGEVITTGGGGGDDVALVVVTHARKIAMSLPQKGGRDRVCKLCAPSGCQHLLKRARVSVRALAGGVWHVLACNALSIACDSLGVRCARGRARWQVRC